MKYPTYLQWYSQMHLSNRIASELDIPWPFALQMVKRSYAGDIEAKAVVGGWLRQLAEKLKIS